MSSLKICMVASELAPWAKTGGLADVVSALSAYLHRNKHDVKVVLPLYASIDDQAVESTPVNGLQNLSVTLGPREISFSIERARLPETTLWIYLIRCPVLYAGKSIYTGEDSEYLRFVLLSLAAIKLCQHLRWSPDVFHCNDWHTALIPLYLKTLYRWDNLFARTRSVLTIHNIAYQGIVGTDALENLGFADSAHVLHQQDLAEGRINFLKTGVLYADVVTTVSPTYCKEIQTEKGGMGLHDLLRARSDSVIGILNGADYNEWNPVIDKLIPHHYSENNLAGKEKNKQTLMAELGLRYQKDVPLMGLVSRLTWQKGVSLMEDVLADILERRPLSFAALGSGEPRYEKFLNYLQQRFPGRVCFYRGYNNRLAHWIEAGSDMFLMPSAFEPCGLNQIYSLKYGTIPIVRETGGLADSVQLYTPSNQTGTGIVFKDFNADGLKWAIHTALDCYQNQHIWRQLIENAMKQDFSWDKQGLLYVALYSSLVDRAH